MLSTISEFGHIEIYVLLAEGHWLIFLFLTTLIFYLTFFFYYFSLFYPVFFFFKLKKPNTNILFPAKDTGETPTS